ncbi:sensor histidine kinase [Lewinella cohaerens]|uniref:sensor histidine kinase n=1 Tax=Lewinella cohaerens TaxID=70995 RepID=UPI0003A124D8|nr:ATP-binding protein [Lewinella cohaerens]
MMIQELLLSVDSLKAVSEEERNILEIGLRKLQKEFQRQEFKMKRIEKDKLIVVNILNATIADLERKQLIIKEANEQLSQQKSLIEKKSLLLADNIQKLEHSYKELEEFSYVASHDLKSPLRTIASFSQLIKKRYAELLDERGNEFVDFIVDGVIQMNGVIDALLEYAKVSNQIDTFVNADLNRVVTIVKANLKTEIADHQVTIISDDLPTICGNEIGLVQLFQNLISNGIKFRSAQDPVIKISCKQEGTHWLFRLADNGIGIEEQFQEKIFSPFQRLDKQKTNGMGIGLSICRKVVKMHQGDIHFEPVSTGGTCFVFTLKDQTETKELKALDEPN